MASSITRKIGMKERSDRARFACSCKAAAVSVLVVDAHPTSQRLIATILGREHGLRVVECVDSGRAAIERIRALRPEIVLIDLMLPDLDPIDLTRWVRRESNHTAVIVLAAARSEARARLALKAGARAYVRRGLVRQELARTVRSVCRQVDSHRVHIEAGEPAPGAQALLSTREIEVLSLVATGHSNRALAACLSMSEETAKGHVKNILSKLNANDRTHAVTLALSLGILELT